MKELEKYAEVVKEVEEIIVDDDEFPVVKDSKIKRCCQVALEITKCFIQYLKFNINATKEKNK